MLRKFIITVICCLSISVLCAVPSYAAGFGGGQRGGGFGDGGFSANTISTYLSYDALSNLCAEINYNLERNVYASDGFPSSGKYAATIVSRSDGYYISVYKAGSYTWFRNPSGGFYICKYDTDSLLSNISSRFDLLMAENGYLRAFYNSLNSIDSRLENLMASPSGYLANINEKLGNAYSTLVSMNATLDKLMSSPSGYLANINEKLGNLYSTLVSMNAKLDKLMSSDNSDVVAAVNGVSDMLEKLFGEYHSTYTFPSIRDREVSFSSSSSSGSLMVSGVDAYTLSFIPENYYPNYCVWYIPRSYVDLCITEFTSSGGLYSGHKATISNPMGDVGGFWYEYKEKFSVSNTSGLPSVVYRDMSFFDLGSTYISLTNVPCSLDYDRSGNVTVSVLLAPVQSSDGTFFFRTNSFKMVPCSGKTLCPTRVRPDNITKEYQWFIYADYSDPVSVYFPAYFNSFLEKQFNRVVDLLGSSGGPSDLTSVTTRLDTIIEQLQTTSGESSCDHTYTQDVTQAPTCILPGLQVSTCSQCGDSYSEILAALGHDWLCTSHVEAVTDPDTGEVTQSGYDIYTCSRCGDTYNDYAGDGAPSDYGDTSLSKIIVKLFSKLGTFAGKIISWIIGLFDKMLSGLNDIVTRFSDLTAQITGFGGDYPTWLSGFWGILPQEFQLSLTFSFVCVFIGVIGRKLFFA